MTNDTTTTTSVPRGTLRLTQQMEAWRQDTIENESIALAHAVARMTRTDAVRWFQERAHDSAFCEGLYVPVTVIREGKIVGQG